VESEIFDFIGLRKLNIINKELWVIRNRGEKRADRERGRRMGDEDC
jgi:hypothetical protein